MGSGGNSSGGATSAPVLIENHYCLQTRATWRPNGGPQRIISPSALQLTDYKEIIVFLAHGRAIGIRVLTTLPERGEARLPLERE
jgi:hypothetical protein